MPPSIFNAGDRVMLTSGGAVMTIETIDGPVAHCTWFVDGKRLERATFQLTSLVPAPPRRVGVTVIGPRPDRYRHL